MSNIFQIIIAIIVPLGLAISSLCSGVWTMALAAILSAYILVGGLPVLKAQKVKWIFLLMFLICLPINISVIVQFLSSWLFCDSWIITNILRGAVWTMIILSVEEIVFTFIARLLWPQ